MKFLYKIHSGYDGFHPGRIVQRLNANRQLRLGWDRYLDSIETGDEVWIYFHGPHRFINGVYAKTVVKAVDFGGGCVFVGLRDYSLTNPLSDQETSARAAQAVAIRFRQVFLLPEEWTTAPNCDMRQSAMTCGVRRCEYCGTWQGLPRIAGDDYNVPERIRNRVRNFISGFWVIPRRSAYVGLTGPGINRTSELFYRFKTGQQRLAHPLALALFEALRENNLLNFDCIVPIPLSPDKAADGEIHRTRLLSQELGRLMATPVRELLTLDGPISKRRIMKEEGLSAPQFEQRYTALLSCPDVIPFTRILIVDDVATKGSTLRCAANRLLSKNPNAEITLAAAGLMVLGSTVAITQAIAV